MSDTTNSGNTNNALLDVVSAFGGAWVGANTAKNNNGGNGGGSNGGGVTSDQVDAKLSAMEGRQDRDALAASIAALGLQVNAGNAATATKLCEIDMRVVTEASATRSRIDQLEIGTLTREGAAKDLRIAELLDAQRHAATQNIIVNAQASASAANAGGGCANQLTQALQLAALLRQNQCCPTGTGSGN